MKVLILGLSSIVTLVHFSRSSSLWAFLISAKVEI